MQHYQKGRSMNLDIINALSTLRIQCELTKNQCEEGASADNVNWMTSIIYRFRSHTIFSAKKNEGKDFPFIQVAFDEWRQFWMIATLKNIQQLHWPVNSAVCCFCIHHDYY